MKAAELFDIKGDVVAITGAASGIGLAIAEVLAANQARLAIFDVDQASLDLASDRLTQAGAEVFARSVDVRDRGALRAAFDAAVEHYGGLDTVFANAGIGAGPGFLGLDGARHPGNAIEVIADHHWDDVIAVNLSGVFATIQAAVRHMKPRRRGRIIVTTSIASFRNETWVGTPYMPAKAGTAHLVRQAALELAEFNISVNAILLQPTLAAAASNRRLSPQQSAGRSRRSGSPIPEKFKGSLSFSHPPRPVSSPGLRFLLTAELHLAGPAECGSRHQMAD